VIKNFEYMNLLPKKLSEFGELKHGVAMSNYTTLHIGGPVQFLIEVTETEKLLSLLVFLTGEGIAYHLLGGGSNVLWQDAGFEGVVIKVRSSKSEVRGDTLCVDAGTPLATAVTTAIKHNLDKLVWAAGVPGTVGGAVRGNAGAMDSDTGKTLKSVDVWRNGEVITLKPETCGFSYRDSVFKHSSDIILSATYQLVPGDKVVMMRRMADFLKQRTGKYPALPSAGSFFKNVSFADWKGEISKLPEHFAKAQKVPAGWISEQNGLKGYRVGGAMLSKEHGNFIVNVDNALQADVLAVVDEIQHRAYTNFGITLEPEVVIIKK
jgi:UDP-N-acetylmuramate dehydrogenase